jgi:hypothetical protein
MLTASVAALWVMMVFVLGVVLLVYKQVGELVMDVNPARDPDGQGPEVGEAVPPISGYDLTLADQVTYTPTNELLIFAMPGCPGCEQISSALPEIAEANPSRSITFLTVFSDSDFQNASSELHRVVDLVLPEAIRTPESRKQIRVLAAHATSEDGPHRAYGVVGTPFGLLVDEKGRVLEKAALRAVHHLERLAESGNEQAQDVARLERTKI